MEWLNENLKMEIKKVFEPKYGRELLDTEVSEVALNLVNYVEAKTKFILKISHSAIVWGII